MDEKFFAAATFEGLRIFIFETVEKNLLYTLVCMSFLCTSREDTTKQILFMRSKFDFLHADIQFDLPKCEFSLKHSSLKCWLCFRLFFWRTQK